MVPSVFMKDYETLKTDGKLSLNGTVTGTYNSKELPSIGMPLLDKKVIDIDEVWRIYKNGSKIIFQSFTKIMILEGGSVTAISPPEPLQFSFFIGENYYVQGKSGNFYLFNNNRFTPFNDHGTFKGIQVWAVLKMDEERYLFATINHVPFPPGSFARTSKRP